MPDHKPKLFTFSREITLGDLILALAFMTPALIWGATAEARLEEHDRALALSQVQMVQIQQSQATLSQSVAVIETRLNFNNPK